MEVGGSSGNPRAPETSPTGSWTLLDPEGQRENWGYPQLSAARPSEARGQASRQSSPSMEVNLLGHRGGWRGRGDLEGQMGGNRNDGHHGRALHTLTPWVFRGALLGWCYDSPILQMGTLRVVKPCSIQASPPGPQLVLLSSCQWLSQSKWF